ncbi:MAG: hypothetical protein LBQ70_05750 [Prevotellaceae bacterium]|nr:hypothetical protein [Prevotellaceae bacterium]
MRKLVFNVFSVLAISTCLLSCSKDDKNQVSPATKADIVGNWSISAEPVIGITITGAAEQQQKMNDSLKFLFHRGDKYLFNEDLSCTIKRGNSTAPAPKTYAIAGNYLTFDGFIKFSTNLSDDKKTLTLTAGDAEIKEMVRVELLKPKYGYDESLINSILNFVKGEVKLSFSAEEQ